MAMWLRIWRHNADDGTQMNIMHALEDFGGLCIRECELRGM